MNICFGKFSSSESLRTCIGAYRAENDVLAAGKLFVAMGASI